MHTAIPPDVLGCLVAGFEKGGTTLVKDLVRRAGRLRGSFEGGLLLADSPAEGVPEPYGSLLVKAWGLPEGFLDEYRTCRTFEEGYRLLRDRSDVITEKHRPLIDKTPRYMMHLEAVLRRAPTTPVVVVIREPALVVRSWLGLGQPRGEAVEAVRNSATGLAAVARSRTGIDRVYTVHLDDLMISPQATLDAMSAWLGFVPRPHDPSMLVGTRNADGVHTGIDPERNDSSRVFTAEQRGEIEAALADAGPEVAWVRGLTTGPLAEASIP